MSLLNREPEGTILREIHNFVAEDTTKLKAKTKGVAYYDIPLVGFANANDPLFTDYKEIIGGFHMTPMEILEHAFPKHEVLHEGASVISWALPVSEYVRESNRSETRCCMAGGTSRWDLCRTQYRPGNRHTVVHTRLWRGSRE